MGYRDKIRRLCLDSMMLCISLLLSYIEAILPLASLVPLPGFKLGLANILITLVFFKISAVDAGVISLCRIIISSMLFGNASSFSFALCGGILSYIGLWIFSFTKGRFFSMIGISVGCAALHNTAQIACGMFWFGEAVLGYLPVLLFASLIYGTVTGVILQSVTPHIKAPKHKKTA